MVATATQANSGHRTSSAAAARAVPGAGRLCQPAGGQGIAPRVRAGAGGGADPQFVAEAAVPAAPGGAAGDHAADGRVLARVRAVAADLVAARRGVDDDLL